MSWTDERVEKLKELWGEGMSASQIAKQLGGVTRNAVIGKVHRLGLSNRAAAAPSTAPASEEPARPAAAAQPAPEPARPAPKPAPEPVAEPEEAAPLRETAPAPVVEPQRREPVIRDAAQPRPPGPPTPEEESARQTLAEIEKMAKRLDLLDLTERTCKWPIGDPTEDNFHFCGLPSVAGKPYCEHHVQVAFQPMSTRRDRSRSAR